MGFQLRDKTAPATGFSTGIGRGMALAAEGARNN